MIIKKHKIIEKKDCQREQNLTKYQVKSQVGSDCR